MLHQRQPHHRNDHYSSGSATPASDYSSAAPGHNPASGDDPSTNYAAANHLSGNPARRTADERNHPTHDSMGARSVRADQRRPDRD